MMATHVYSKQYNNDNANNNNNSAHTYGGCQDVAVYMSTQYMSAEHSCVDVDHLSTPRCSEDASQSEPQPRMMTGRR